MVKRGEVQTTLLEGMCIPVSLTDLGLVQIQEDAIQGLNQSVARVELHDDSRITEGSDYKTVWYLRTVHKTIGYLGWSCTKLISKHINNEGVYLVEGTKNCFSDRVAKWTFKSKIDSPIHNPQPWRYVVGVKDGFFYHLDNDDK